MTEEAGARAGSFPLLVARGMTKTYGGVTALAGADLVVLSGEVHALLGENGAGKSTLIKIFAGAVEPDSGSLDWKGEPTLFPSRRESRDAGISVIFQHGHLIPELTVAENLSLGVEPRRFGIVNRSAVRAHAHKALARIGVRLDIDTAVRNLRVAERQLVEIAAALAQDAELVIMDEPTASLGPREVDELLEVMGQLAAQGAAVLYISHRLEEIQRVADRVTVLRDGSTVAQFDAQGVTEQQLISSMVGRAVVAGTPPSMDGSAPVVLEASRIATDSGLHDVSLTVRRGEVLGVYGLLGSGRTELLRALCGADRLREGFVAVDGRVVKLRTPADAKRAGIGFVAEDRATQGVLPTLSVRANLVVSVLGSVSRLGWVHRHREQSLANRAIDDLGVVARFATQPIDSLSGGNQQKVVVGRWLLSDLRVLLLDDPTVGVDVAAKAEIHALVRAAADAGCAVVLATSETSELLSLSSRVALMYRRRFVGELTGADLSEQRVLELAVGGQ